MTSIDLRTVPGSHLQDVPDRCGGCGKRLCVDLGGTVFGEVDGLPVCLHCEVPEAYWSAYDARRTA